MSEYKMKGYYWEVPRTEKNSALFAVKGKEKADKDTEKTKKDTSKKHPSN